MATARLINIEDAKLRTLSVEIKALTVSGKQMTLSTFRQLPEEEIWVDGPGGDFSYRGVPWGRVLYKWGDYAKDGWFVVWQHGNQLHRAFIYPLQVEQCHSSGGGRHFIQEQTGALERERKSLADAHNELRGLKSGETPTPSWLEIPAYNNRLTPAEWREKEIAKVTAQITQHGESIERRQREIAEMEVAVRLRDERRKNALDSIADLLALPQLFIAV